MKTYTIEHRKLKIIHLQLFPIISGVQKVSLHEISELKNEIDYTLICKEKGQLSEVLKKQGVKVFFIESLSRNISLLDDLRSFISIYKLLKREKPDILHTHSSKTGVLGRFAAFFLGIRSVHTVHGYSFPTTKNIFLKFFYFCVELVSAQTCGKLIVMNQRDMILSKLLFARKKTIMLNNGVECFTPPEIIKNLKNPLEILFVGRLEPQKDPMMFIEIISKLDTSKYNFKIIGDGSLHKEMEKKIRDLDLKTVEMCGWKDDVGVFLETADVIISTSLWEGMPLTIIEAMYYGVIPIVTEISGHVELVRNHEIGFLYKPGDFSVVEKSLQILDANRAKLHLQKNNVQTHIMSHHNLKDRHAKIMETYRCLMR